MNEQLFLMRRALRQEANSKHAKVLQRFFKTGPGEYGEGDKFIGIKVPVLRSIAKKYHTLNYKELKDLLSSEIHEERLISLFILETKFRMSEEREKEKIFNFYIRNRKRVNNWDLIDLSAPNIIGNYLYDKERQLLYELVISKNLWERRMAVMASFAFIKKNDFDDALKLAGILLKDEHDLIHKAVGWMLREIGKRNLKTEEAFLKKYYKQMPRTMLRYAIEKFPEKQRQAYLKGKK